jgi:hypothetical protein
MRSFADNTGRNWTNFNLVCDLLWHRIEINATSFEWMNAVEMLRQQPAQLGA